MKKIIIDDKEIEISEKSFEALKAQLISKDTRFVPEEDEVYYTIDDVGMNCTSTWDNSACDIYALGQGNVFKTSEEARQHAKRLGAISKVTNYCYENDLVLTDIDWDDTNQAKYFIIYNGQISCLIGYYTWEHYIKIVLPYLKSKEACNKVIKEMEDELNVIFNIN